MDIMDLEVEVVPTAELTDEFQLIMVETTPPVKLRRYTLALLRDAILEDVTDVQTNLTNHQGNNTLHVNGSAWVNITLLNGWTQISGKRTAAYKILAAGIIALKGRVSGTYATSNVIFTLPELSRPFTATDYVVWGDGSASLLNIATTGNVSAAVPNIPAISLEGVLLVV
jgi:hypothetical protein